MGFKETLTIDTREPPEVIKAFRASKLFDNIVVRELETGDMKIGSLRVERKTFPDYIHSWKEGRLDSQIERLAQLKDEVGIIIVYDTNKASRWIDRNLRMAGLKHLDSLNFVLPIFKARDLEAFIRKVAVFAKHALDRQYLFEFCGRRTEILSSPDDVVNLYAHLASGVSIKLAKRIKKRYPSPEKLIKAIKKCGVLNPPKKGGKVVLMKSAWFNGIKGIGFGKAKQIEELLLLGRG